MMSSASSAATLFNEGARGQSDIGVIGLGVMGENLVINMARHNMKVSVFNRTVTKMEKLIQGRGAEYNLIGCKTLGDYCGKSKKPRRCSC
eukprot:GABW01005126.1.p1 GENE.GABW01005126.1~~GABW01005126.1.p1  ORF type:complete len:90 (+),score=13.65 GABW01005126.1:81-350(+)